MSGTNPLQVDQPATNRNDPLFDLEPPDVSGPHGMEDSAESSYVSEVATFAPVLNQQARENSSSRDSSPSGSDHSSSSSLWRRNNPYAGSRQNTNQNMQTTPTSQTHLSGGFSDGESPSSGGPLEFARTALRSTPFQNPTHNNNPLLFDSFFGHQSGGEEHDVPRDSFARSSTTSSNFDKGSGRLLARPEVTGGGAMLMTPPAVTNWSYHPTGDTSDFQDPSRVQQSMWPTMEQQGTLWQVPNAAPSGKPITLQPGMYPPASNHNSRNMNNNNNNNNASGNTTNNGSGAGGPKGGNTPNAVVPEAVSNYLQEVLQNAPHDAEIACPPGWTFSVYDADISQHYAIDSQHVMVTQGAFKYADFYKKYGVQTRFRFQLCKRYLNSRCTNGKDCQYIHSRVLPRSTQVHINENCATSAAGIVLTAEMVRGGHNTLGYETLPAGAVLSVFPPNNAVVLPQQISSEAILRTVGAMNVFQVLQNTQRQLALAGGSAAAAQQPHNLKPRHCAHFQFKRMCNLGSECNFIHSLVPYIQALSSATAGATPQSSAPQQGSGWPAELRMGNTTLPPTDHHHRQAQPPQLAQGGYPTSQGGFPPQLPPQTHQQGAPASYNGPYTASQQTTYNPYSVTQPQQQLPSAGHSNTPYTMSTQSWPQQSNERHLPPPSHGAQQQNVPSSMYASMAYPGGAPQQQHQQQHGGYRHADGNHTQRMQQSPYF